MSRAATCVGSNIASDAEAVRLNLRELAGDQLPPELQAGGRTEVLPVQWRKHLNLEVCAWLAACLHAPAWPACVQRAAYTWMPLVQRTSPAWGVHMPASSCSGLGPAAKHRAAHRAAASLAHSMPRLGTALRAGGSRGGLHGEVAMTHSAVLTMGHAPQVDKVAEKLMLPGVRSLRAMLHATFVEVLFAISPRHLQDMLDSLVGFLNAQHAKFAARHPGFKASRAYPWVWLPGRVLLQQAGAMAALAHTWHVVSWVRTPRHADCAGQVPAVSPRPRTSELMQ